MAHISEFAAKDRKSRKREVNMYQKLIDQISTLLCEEYGYTMTYSRNLDMHLPMRRSEEEEGKGKASRVYYITDKLSDSFMWVGGGTMYLIIDHSEEYIGGMVRTYQISSNDEIMVKFIGNPICYGQKDLYIVMSLMRALIDENSDNYHIVYEVYSFILIQEFLFKINGEPQYYIFIEDIIDVIIDNHAKHIEAKKSSVIPQKGGDGLYAIKLLLKTEKNMLSRDEVLDAIESTRARSLGVDVLYFRFLQKNLIAAEELEQYDAYINAAESAAHIFRKALDLYSYPTQLTGILEDFYSSLKWEFK